MPSFLVTPDPTSDQESLKRREIIAPKQVKIPQAFAERELWVGGSTFLLESRRS